MAWYQSHVTTISCILLQIIESYLLSYDPRFASFPTTPSYGIMTIQLLGLMNGLFLGIVY